MSNHNIDCNVHLCSFSKGMEVSECDRLPSDTPLGLDGIFTFVYDYPLSKKATFDHPLISSVSAIDILAIAKADYEFIYAAEEADDGPTENIPGMLNRASSDGRYGIWGHCIEDLFFEGIKIDESNIVEFVIGS